MKTMEKISLSLCLMFWSLYSFASSDNFDNDFLSDPGFPGEDPGAPIDDYIIPAMVLIMLYGFYKHYKRKQLNQQLK
jgi:hypothetical protein